MEIEWSQLVRAVRRLWWVPLVSALIAGLLGFGVGQMQSPSYTATTQMLVTEQVSGTSVLAESDRTATFVTLVTSGPVLDRVILELGLDISREDLAEMITANTISGTQIIEIAVVSDSSQLSADIANSLSRNMVTTASDLSIGELQRNLDEMRQQASSTRDRITVVDARLAEIDTEENAEDSQVQAEIVHLERERLQLSQTLADLDGSIRELNTSLSTSSIPVVITDFAAPSDNTDSVGSVLLAILGVLVGGLIGVAWILYSAFSDRILRDADQTVSAPVLEKLSKEDLHKESARGVDVLAGKIEGSSKAAGARTIAIVSPSASDAAGELVSQLSQNLAGENFDVMHFNGMLDDAKALRSVANADVMVVIAEVNVTRVDDLVEVTEYAQLVKARILGTVLIGR